MTTLRPRGPSVTLTASASALTPRSRERRAFSSNWSVLAMGYGCPFRGSWALGAWALRAWALRVWALGAWGGGGRRRHRPGGPGWEWPAAGAERQITSRRWRGRRAPRGSGTPRRRT